jgi:hypothetical protein
MLRLQRTGDRVFMQFKTDADQNSGILFGDVDDDVECAIEYEPANQALTLSTGNNAEAMRIDSSGNVGIGVTPENSNGTWRNLQFGGGNLAFRNGGANDAMVGTGYLFKTDNSEVYKNTEAVSRLFFNNDEMIFQQAASGTAGTSISWSERMRIDTSGNLLYDCTNVSQQTDDGIKFVSNGRIFTVSGYDSSAQENFSMYSTGASAFRFYVDWGGTIHATSTSISAISDQRLKENIVNLETGLTEVMALKPRRFDWKNGDKINVAGFIAQEVETVLPDLIDGFKNDTIEDAKGVRMGDMIPTLVKAIQEQQTIIDDLKARIETLEGG